MLETRLCLMNIGQSAGACCVSYRLFSPCLSVGARRGFLWCVGGRGSGLTLKSFAWVWNRLRRSAFLAPRPFLPPHGLCLRPALSGFFFARCASPGLYPGPRGLLGFGPLPPPCAPVQT